MLAATAVAEDTHYWFKGLRRTAGRLLHDALDGRRAGRVVDCGAGTGRNLEWLAQYGRAVGVELTPLAIDIGHARKRPLIRGSVDALPFADATFGLATSFDVLYCLPDEVERQAIAEMWRVLEPGGIVLVNAAALDVLRGSHSTLTHEVRRYTRQKLSNRLTMAGFKVQRVTYTNFVLFPPTLAVRGWQQLSGQAARASESDLAVPSPLVNGLLDRLLRIESAALGLTNMPIGTSVMAIGRKPK